MEDAAIVELYWARSESAIRETSAKYGGYCYAIAHNILMDREDSDECVNDTYLAAWNSMPPHNPCALAAFLGKLTRRISLNRWRDKRTGKRGGGEVALALDELNDCVPASVGVEAELLAGELEKTIAAFVRSLPTSERRVFVCRYFYLEPIASISKRFSFTQSKVKSMLARSRERLAKQLESEGFIYER